MIVVKGFKRTFLQNTFLQLHVLNVDMKNYFTRRFLLTDLQLIPDEDLKRTKLLWLFWQFQDIPLKNLKYSKLK